MLSDLLINTAPKHPIALISKNETIYFRPFLVREEKALLLALDMGETGTIMKAIADIITSCCEKISNPLELPIYEIENIFLQIRAKSVGEIIELNIEDEETGEIIEIPVNIDDIKISSKPSEGKLEISKDIIVNFRYPTLQDFMDSVVDLSTTEGYYNLIAKCLIKINTPSESINTETYELDEIKNFLESMNKTHTSGKDKSITLEGIQDFFGLPSVILA